MTLPYVYMTLQDDYMTLQDVKMTLQSQFFEGSQDTWMHGFLHVCKDLPAFVPEDMEDLVKHADSVISFRSGPAHLPRGAGEEDQPQPRGAEGGPPPCLNACSPQSRSPLPSSPSPAGANIFGAEPPSPGGAPPH